MILARRLKRTMVTSSFFGLKILHKNLHLADRVVRTIFDHGEPVNQNPFENFATSGVVVHVQKSRTEFFFQLGGDTW
jgi:hypothetical protein